MNRYHKRCCRSPGWSAFMAGTVLPHALGRRGDPAPPGAERPGGPRLGWRPWNTVRWEVLA